MNVQNLTILERDQRIVRKLQQLYDAMLVTDDPDFTEEEKTNLREFIREEIELWKMSVKEGLKREKLKRKSNEEPLQPSKRTRTDSSIC